MSCVTMDAGRSIDPSQQRRAALAKSRTLSRDERHDALRECIRPSWSSIRSSLRRFDVQRPALHVLPDRRSLRRSLRCRRPIGAGCASALHRRPCPRRCHYTSTCRSATRICYYCACNKVITKDHGALREVPALPRARDRAGGRARSGETHGVGAAALGRRHADLPRRDDEMTRADGDRSASSFQLDAATASTRSRSIRAAPAPETIALLAELGFNRVEPRRAGLRSATCSRRSTASRAWRRRAP